MKHHLAEVTCTTKTVLAVGAQVPVNVRGETLLRGPHSLICTAVHSWSSHTGLLYYVNESFHSQQALAQPQAYPQIK